MFDAEHFFDGYKADPGYRAAPASRRRPCGRRALAGAVRHQRRHPAARDRSASVERGGGRSRPTGSASTPTTTPKTPWPTSLAAVEAGCASGPGHPQRARRALRQRQHGLADPEPEAEDRLSTIGVGDEQLTPADRSSRALDELLNRTPEPARRLCRRPAPSPTRAGCTSRRSPRIRAPTSMSRPENVGNRRHIVVSDQAGRVQRAGAARGDRHGCGTPIGGRDRARWSRR